MQHTNNNGEHRTHLGIENDTQQPFGDTLVTEETTSSITGIENDTQQPFGDTLVTEETASSTTSIIFDTLQPLRHTSSVADSSFLINIAPK